jgi:hypothetical protein
MGKVSLIDVPVADAPRVRELAIDAPATLLVTWHDGSRTSHDLSATIRDNEWAAALRDPTVFRTARIEDDGWRIVWPGTDIDFSAEGLWDDVHPRHPKAAKWMSAEDFTAWMRKMVFTFADASEALDVSPRMLKYYAAGTHEVPKTVFLACMQLASKQR